MGGSQRQKAREADRGEQGKEGKLGVRLQEPELGIHCFHDICLSSSSSLSSLFSSSLPLLPPREQWQQLTGSHFILISLSLSLSLDEKKKRRRKRRGGGNEKWIEREINMKISENSSAGKHARALKCHCPSYAPLTILS